MASSHAEVTTENGCDYDKYIEHAILILHHDRVERFGSSSNPSDFGGLFLSVVVSFLKLYKAGVYN